MTPTILITRPEPAAFDFADALRGRLGCGVPVIVSPLMRVEPVGALPDLDRIRGLIFTSRAGVDSFARLTDRRDLPAWCVGDRTAEAAQQAGIKARSAGGDAEALIAMLRRARVKGPLLHLRGAHTRGDVAARLAAQEAVIYNQLAQPLNEQAIALLGRESPVILPLFSPRSAQLFFLDAPPMRAPLRVAAMSQAVAQQVPDGAAQQLIVAERPEAGAMIDAVSRLI